MDEIQKKQYEYEAEADAELDRLYTMHQLERKQMQEKAMLALKSARTPQELISIKKENERKFRILANEQKDEYAQVCKDYPAAFSQ